MVQMVELENIKKYKKTNKKINKSKNKEDLYGCF